MFQFPLFRYLDNILNIEMGGSVQKVFEALSDPTRRQILELLKGRSKSVQELGESFSISGASLSHHLNKLKTAGLVKAERQGQKIYYSIHTTVFQDASKLLADFFNIGEDNDK